MMFSIKDFFGKYDQIRKKLRIWSDLLKKCLMENFYTSLGFLMLAKTVNNNSLKYNSK